MPIGGSASWSTLRIPEGQELFVSQYGVESYFYRLGMPEALSELFCLDPVPASLAHRSGAPLYSWPEGGAWYPCLRVVPMGWSRAMWFAQRVHMRAYIVAGGPRSAILFDGRPSPEFSEQPLLRMPYSDNGNVISTDASAGAAVAAAIRAQLKTWGLHPQEITVPEVQFESLGVLVDGAAGLARRPAAAHARCHWLRVSLKAAAS